MRGGVLTGLAPPSVLGGEFTGETIRPPGLNRVKSKGWVSYIANRRFTQFRYSLEKAPVDVFVTFTGAGAANPTLNSWTGTAVGTAGSAGYKGVKSITRNGVGDYTITFQDTFNRLLSVEYHSLSIDGATTPVVPNVWIKAVSPTATGGATLRIVTYGAAPGTPVEAGTNDRVYMSVTWSNSNAQ